MQSMKKYLFPLVIMCFFSVGLLIGLSVLTYIFKWKADQALIGITFVYIAAGFIGGKANKRMSYEMSMGRKLIDGFAIGTVFVFLLLLLSFLFIEQEFTFGSRFITIWLLMAGSAALGRIL